MEKQVEPNEAVSGAFRNCTTKSTSKGAGGQGEHGYENSTEVNREKCFSLSNISD